MRFTVRKFLREVPIGTLKAYFDSKHAPVPEDWWEQEQSKLVAQLAEYLVSERDQIGADILAEMVRVHPMASERGRNSLLNASARSEDIVRHFGMLANDHERALWMLMTHSDLFREGEELHFFDHQSEGSRGRHHQTLPNQSVSREAADIEVFKTEVCDFHRRRDGSGISCEIEFADRHRENGIQVAVYIQGLPNNGMEFVNGQHTRRISNPSLEAAIVYEPLTGHTSTVTKGGKDAHEALRDAFARRLLKIQPQFEVVKRRSFLLDALKVPTALSPDPELGVRAVRVRRLKLAPPAFDSGTLTIEAPAQKPDRSVYDLGNSCSRSSLGSIANSLWCTPP